MTPKSLLRAEVSRSSIEEFTSGGFRVVVDDPATGAGPPIGDHELAASSIDPAEVTRVVLCSGKIAFDAMRWREKHREDRPDNEADTAVVRVEQLYPWPEEALADVLGPLPGCHRTRLAPGRAREHGGLAVRARPPPPTGEGPLRAAAREQARVGEPGDRERCAAQLGARGLDGARTQLSSTSYLLSRLLSRSYKSSSQSVIKGKRIHY